MTPHLYIDTNVYLSFYHFSEDDLEELRKLVVLVKDLSLQLVLPAQTVDEFRRNRASKIADALQRLRTQKLNLEYPQLCRHYDQYKELRRLQRNFDRAHAELMQQVDEDVASETLKADEVIEELFERAMLIDVDDSILAAARRRTDVGNPPGKLGSLGDALNWEALLAAVPDDADLYIVTDDMDYASALDRDSLNPFLADEWSDEKGGTVTYYRSLSRFCKDRYPDIKLASALEKELLIRKLATSGTFMRTHTIVAQLRRFDDFTSAEARAIVEAAVANTQVSWIASDSDVQALLEKVIKVVGPDADIEGLSDLEEQMYPQPDEEQVEDDDDDFPF